MKPENKHPNPIKFTSEVKLPYFTVSMATTEWNETGTWRYMRPRYVERVPACQHSCPTSNNIETWIRYFEQGKLEDAWSAATLENPFPSIMGRVCFHPCMDGCNRRELGGSVNINMLERALGDAMGQKLPTPKPFFSPTGKKVAVVGAGPSGLACAFHLTRLGHTVTVFDRAPLAGGMLRYGIPSYRLPKDILDREIEALKSMGIEFCMGKNVRDATAIQDIRRDHNAVFMSVGAQKSKAMGITGEKSTGVSAGLEFLRQVVEGKQPHVGKKVLVVGGGNTAVDAARTARRMGAEVSIVYRRSRAEMPAFEDEIKQAEEEGVKVEILVSPLEVTVQNNKVSGLICQKMKLDEPDESGRRRPIPIDGETTTFAADTVLTAIGEEIDTSIIPSALPIEHGALKTRTCGRTEWQNVFAGGDFIAEPRTVVDAIASGKRSAIAMDCYLRGENIEEIFEKVKVVDTDAVMMSRYLKLRTGKKLFPVTTSEQEDLNAVTNFSDLNPVYFSTSNPNPYPSLNAEERLEGGGFNEIHNGPSEETKKNELARCFHCGRCTECDNCYIYCPDVAIAKKEGGFEFDHHFCKGCGVCVHECPRAAMQMIEEPTEF